MAGTKYYATVGDKSISTTQAGLGSTNNLALKSAFPHSPLYKAVSDGGIDENEREKEFIQNVLIGEVQNGNGFANFNRDYSKNGMPDIPNITEDNAGKPLYSPYIPNPTSPGPGSMNADDKPMHSVPAKTQQEIISENKQFGTGYSGVFNPIEYSKSLEDQGIIRTLGNSLPE